MENLLSIINTILENRGREKCESISAETDLKRDLGFDSFDLAEFTVRIEVEYDVDVFEDGIVYTIGDILDRISV
jgi:acyl carrier protein